MTSPNKTLSKDERSLLASECYLDPVLFLRTFLKDWFPTEIPWVHRGIVAIITRRTAFLSKYGELEKIRTNFIFQPDFENAPEVFKHIFSWNEAGDELILHANKFTLIMMPRGFSKTTLLNGLNLHNLLYQERPFTLYVSEAQPHAERQVKSLRIQLEQNEHIKEVFGFLKPAQRSGLSWSDEICQTASGVTIAARGRGGQIRGFNINGVRPWHITVDDVESKESVNTQDQRSKALEWFYGDLMPALPELVPDASITALGTLLHRESLLQTCRKDKRWVVVIFGAIDRDGELLWELNLDAKKLEEKKAAYTAIGKLHLYYMEYFNQIRANDMARFTSDQFIYNKPDPTEHLNKAILIDPAISEDPGADYTAITVVSMSEKGIIHVHDCWMKRGALPREQIDVYFEMAKLYIPTIHGVESIGLGKALVHLMREEMFRKSYYFEIEEIKSHKKAAGTPQRKIDRVTAILQPRFANGYITFERRFPRLEEQLLDWPQGKKDGPDALSMAIALLDPFAAQAADPEKDLAKDEYEPLGSWGVQ